MGDKNQRSQRLLINRLGQIFIRSRFQAGDDVLRVGAGGDENDRDEPDASYGRAVAHRQPP
jgi:hypothetical protein